MPLVKVHLLYTTCNFNSLYSLQLQVISLARPQTPTDNKSESGTCSCHLGFNCVFIINCLVYHMLLMLIA